MRVNVYAEEMTSEVELVEKVIDGRTYVGVRLYLHLPVTRELGTGTVPEQVRGPFIHRLGDDDSSAITFWGKRDLRAALKKMTTMLDKYYGKDDV